MAGEVQTLIAELEAAEAGSRKLSDRVLLALGWQHTTPRGYWYKPDGGCLGTYSDRPDPTRSLDSAVDLVPEGTNWSVEFEQENSFPHLEGRGWTETRRYMGVLENKVEPQFPYEEFGATAALSLCISILKAVETEND